MYVDTESDYALKNLKVEGSVRGYNAGGIVSILNAGEISGCSFSGDITVTTLEGEDVVSELISELADDDIDNVDDIEVRDYIPGNSMHYGKINAGGIAGYTSSGSKAVRNTAASGSSVNAESYSVGGIIGLLETNKGAVYYNTSRVTIGGNAQYKGGIVGALVEGTTAAVAVGAGNSNYSSGADYVIGKDEHGQATNNTGSTGGGSSGGSDETIYQRTSRKPLALAMGMNAFRV